MTAHAVAREPAAAPVAAAESERAPFGRPPGRTTAAGGPPGTGDHRFGDVRITPLDGPPKLQRSLVVNPSTPTSLPTGAVGRPDPASSLTAAQRFSMMDSLIQGLCDDFEVDSGTGEVLDKSRTSRPRAEIAASGKPVGCCCLAILTGSPNTWTIEVSQVVAPRTFRATRQVVLSPTTTPVEFGAWTASGALAFQGAVPTAGHELCGHAALMEVGAHPVGGDRLREDVHDPTVNIENLISTEQGIPPSQLRGLAASGPHRGESVDRITVANYPFNGTSPSALPPAERDKLAFAADYVVENDSFVDVIGHSDPVGSASAKLTVSQLRADRARAFLRARGVTATTTSAGTTMNRFTRVQGVSDTQPPPGPLAAAHGNWRRVEVLTASFPAGAQVPPAGTPTVVGAHTRRSTVPALRADPDPCISLLVGTAYP